MPAGSSTYIFPTVRTRAWGGLEGMTVSFWLMGVTAVCRLHYRDCSGAVAYGQQAYEPQLIPFYLSLGAALP